MNFTDKVLLVTGASSGIGAAIAIMFAKEGADVAIVGRNEKKLSNIAAQLEKNGRKPLVIKADVSVDEDAKRIVKETIERFGKIDVLINNAGIIKLEASILKGDILKVYDDIMRTNLRAVVHLTALAAPHLIKTKGNIINVSSVAGLTTLPDPNFIPYSISKAGLDYFTRGAALELSSHGVRVNSINPGPVTTEIYINANTDVKVEDFTSFTALGRVSAPEEIGNLALFLASDKAKGITGSINVSDNGLLLKL